MYPLFRTGMPDEWGLLPSCTTLHGAARNKPGHYRAGAADFALKNDLSLFRSDADLGGIRNQNPVATGARGPRGASAELDDTRRPGSLRKALR